LSEIRLAEGRESDGCIWCSSHPCYFCYSLCRLCFPPFFLSSRFLKSSCECNAKQISKQTTHCLVSLECVPRFYTTLNPLFPPTNTQYAPTQPTPPPPNLSVRPLRVISHTTPQETKKITYILLLLPLSIRLIFDSRFLRLVSTWILDQIQS
jgi:hypothetical protein